MKLSHTQRRVQRMLLVVPWLLESPGATVDEVSKRFGVPRDELLRDLDLLGYCGLPGYGGGDLVEVNVFGDRITVRMAEFFRRPLQLSVREAVTLLLAARALAGVEEMPESEALARAIERLEGLLGATGQELPRVAVDLRAAGDEHLTILRQAVDEAVVVQITYRSESRGETTTREVEPWTLTAFQGSWYLQGWCRSATGPRDFRLDRIREVRMTGEQAEQPAEPPPPPVYRPEAHHIEVSLEIERDASWVMDHVVLDQSSDAGDRQRITFRVADLDWAARLVLRLAGRAKIRRPPDLGDRVRELAQEALQRYAVRSTDASVNESKSSVEH